MKVPGNTVSADSTLDRQPQIIGINEYAFSPFINLKLSIEIPGVTL